MYNRYKFTSWDDYNGYRITSGDWGEGRVLDEWNVEYSRKLTTPQIAISLGFRQFPRI